MMIFLKFTDLNRNSLEISERKCRDISPDSTVPDVNLVDGLSSARHLKGCIIAIILGVS